MSNRLSNKVINFDFKYSTQDKKDITREQLAEMIRKVLTPAELFKLNAPKCRKKINNHVEVIDFCDSWSEEKNNA